MCILECLWAYQRSGLFLPALVMMILLNNVAEEIGWTGFTFARLQDHHGPLRAALLTTVFFWLYHLPSFYVENTIMAGHCRGARDLLVTSPGQPPHRRLAL